MDTVKAKDEEAPDAPPEVMRGRQQVLATMVTLGGSFALATFLGGMPLVGLLTYGFVLGLLGLQIFRGVAWARYVLSLFCLYLAGVNVYGLVVSLGGDGSGYIVNGALGVVYLWCAFMLAMSKAIGAYTDAQRASREAATRDAK